MKISYVIKLLVASFSFIFLAYSCDVFNEEVKVYTESEKNIEGSWKIISAFRNDVDITDLMDFSRFRVNFGNDGNYTIENYLPFVVSKNGGYALDDPQYPFHLVFTQEGGAEPLETSLSFPTVNAERQIGLTFSPGCGSNTYTYILKRESNN